VNIHGSETLQAKYAGAIRELKAALGDSAVRTSQPDIARVLKDQSWLSPVLQQALEQRSASDGPLLGIEAVVVPASERDVLEAAAIAARHRMPITARGAGTSNFGLVTPEHGGIIVDMRGVMGDARVANGEVSAAAGTAQGVLEKAARARGQELPVLTTTYASATIGGWIAGGHVGLGSGCHGSIWDDNVLSVRLVTVEEVPRVLTLAGAEIVPVLHTFGAMGLITDITFRAVEARDWVEGVACFATFAQASAFTTEISGDKAYHHRAMAAQEAALMPGLKPLASILQPGAAGVLMLFDGTQFAALQRIAASHGGSVTKWQSWRVENSEKPSIAAMVYGHRMLWVKRLIPDAAFLHIYFDPADPDQGARLLKQRYGDELLIEMKFVRSPWMLRTLGCAEDGTLPAAVVAVRNGTNPGKVEEVLRYCDDVGLRYQNSHTNVIEDNGLFPDIAPILKLKSSADPHNLLNRGRLRSAVTKP
jgi:hypothetical protein